MHDLSVWNPSMFFNLRSKVLFQASITFELDGRSALFFVGEEKIEKLTHLALLSSRGEYR